MMLALDDMREEFQLLVRRTLTEVLTHEHLLGVLDADTDADTSWHVLAELGVFGVAAPVDAGGGGQPLLLLAVAAEEVGFAAVPGGALGQWLAVTALADGQDDAARERWLPELVAGRVRAAAVLGGRPFAERHGALSGEAPFVLGACDADLFIVPTTSGLGLVAAEESGVTTLPVPTVDRTRRAGRVLLDDTRHVPLGDRVLAERIVGLARLLLAADAYGGARRCLELAIDHVRARNQFGVPIAQFQAVRHQLADLAARIEPGQALLWHAAELLDDRDTAEDRVAAVAVAAAKAHLTELFTDAARQAVRLHGALGYTWDGPVHPWLKRAVVDQTLCGTPDALRAFVAAHAGW